MSTTERPALNLTTLLIYEGEVTQTQRDEMHQLQVACFSDVPYDEIMEDFVAAPIARVLSYHDAVMVGCVSVYKRTIIYAGQPVVMGGFGGTCTRTDMRGRGVGTAVCRVAMDALHAKGCAVAMLAVGAGKGTERFYEPFGFRLLGRPFVFVNVHGEHKTPDNDMAMLAPVASSDVFAAIMAGTEPLDIGPEPGYW